MGVSSSKVQFGSNMNTLITKDVDPNDHPFWDEIWKTTLSVDEIFELISPNDVRRLCQEKLRNIKTLFTQAVAQLYQVVETPYPVYFNQALNCTKILSRFLPFLHEMKSKRVMDLFWKRQSMLMHTRSAESATIDTDEKSEYSLSSTSITPVKKKKTLLNTHRTSSNASTTNTTTTTNSNITSNMETPRLSSHFDTQECEPLAVILINTLFHIMFLPDFTIQDPHMEFMESDMNTESFRAALLWSPGLGSTEKTITYSSTYDVNRIHILRVMLCAFCDTLYTSPQQYDHCANYWLEVATSANAPYADLIFYSLINTVLGYDPVGWGLPYTNLLAVDTAKSLMTISIQVLLILLDYGYPISNNTSNTNNQQQSTHRNTENTTSKGDGYQAYSDTYDNNMSVSVSENESDVTTIRDRIQPISSSSLSLSSSLASPSFKTISVATSGVTTNTTTTGATNVGTTAATTMSSSTPKTTQSPTHSKPLSSSSSSQSLIYIDPNDSDHRGFNIFRKLLYSISDPKSLYFLYKGFTRLLNNIHESENTLLPYSISRIQVEEEVLILLWKCLDEIPAFIPYILKECDVTEILVPICYLLITNRKNNQKTGLIFICTFILLKLSGERSFSVTLNKSCQMRLHIDISSFEGTYADLLVIVLHKMIVSGSEKLSPLYNCFLTIICNISPYFRGLKNVAAVKLVNLFQLFTSPQFLYQSDSNHIYVTLLLETFNNIIQYQYEGNVHVIYAIVKRKEIFESLHTLSLDNAKEQADEAHRVEEEIRLKNKLNKKKKASNNHHMKKKVKEAPDITTTIHNGIDNRTQTNVTTTTVSTENDSHSHGNIRNTGNTPPLDAAVKDTTVEMKTSESLQSIHTDVSCPSSHVSTIAEHDNSHMTTIQELGAMHITATTILTDSIHMGTTTTTNDNVTTTLNSTIVNLNINPKSIQPIVSPIITDSEPSTITMLTDRHTKEICTATTTVDNVKKDTITLSDEQSTNEIISNEKNNIENTDTYRSTPDEDNQVEEDDDSPLHHSREIKVTNLVDTEMVVNMHSSIVPIHPSTTTTTTTIAITATASNNAQDENKYQSLSNHDQISVTVGDGHQSSSIQDNDVDMKQQDHSNEEIRKDLNPVLSITSNSNTITTTTSTISENKDINQLNSILNEGNTDVARGLNIHVSSIENVQVHVVEEEQYDKNESNTVAIIPSNESKASFDNTLTIMPVSATTSNSTTIAATSNMNDTVIASVDNTQPRNINVIDTIKSEDNVTTHTCTSPHADMKDSSTTKILLSSPSSSSSLVATMKTNRFIPSEEWLQVIKSQLPLFTIMRLLKHLVPQLEDFSKKNHVDENKWGVIFMHNQKPLRLYDGKYVKLFAVSSLVDKY